MIDRSSLRPSATLFLSGQVRRLRWLAIGLGIVAQPAVARDYCPDRPGIDTPPCTIEPGKASAEMSVADWTHDRSPEEVSDAVLIGDLALRVGIADNAEFRLGWTAYGHTRSRDRLTGAVSRASGTGDLALGFKLNLVHPDGKGFSAALLPTLILPTGGTAIGAGDWGAGVQAPISLPLSAAVSLALTPELDAAVNASGRGRHLAFGSAGGVAIAPMPNVSLAIEAQVMRDDEPGDPATRVIAGAALGMMVNSGTQIDIGSEFGLSGGAPDRRIYVGIARRL
jgi:hypothetical protein